MRSEEVILENITWGYLFLFFSFLLMLLKLANCSMQGFIYKSIQGEENE